MATVRAECPYCGIAEVKKWCYTGKARQGNSVCCAGTRRAAIKYFSWSMPITPASPEQRIVEMAMNGAGVRDTGRVLDISPNTVTAVKKTGKFAKPVNEEYFKKLEAKRETDIVISNALAAEMDEMWSFYHDKSRQIWLWWAVDHFACEKRILAERLVTGKKNTRRMERDHLTFENMRQKTLPQNPLLFQE